jgi:hypothetical protein
MHEVEALIRAKQHEMERSTLTIKEEKARLQEMKRMKDDARNAMEWENAFDDIKNKRVQVRAPPSLPEHATPAPLDKARLRSNLTPAPPAALRTPQIAESLMAVLADIGAARVDQSRHETAAELEVPVEDVIEARIPVVDALREFLSSARWRKKLRSECAVVLRTGKNIVRVSGLSDGVEAAARLIAEIGPVVVRRLAVDEAQVAVSPPPHPYTCIVASSPSPHHLAACRALLSPLPPLYTLPPPPGIAAHRPEGSHDRAAAAQQRLLGRSAEEGQAGCAGGGRSCGGRSGGADRRDLHHAAQG